jgi:hypothetical protein
MRRTWLTISILLAATNAATATAVWRLCDAQNPEPGAATAASPRGRGALIAEHLPRGGCQATPYTGPETRLFSDRPYHTASRVEALDSHRFCRGKRHGTAPWLFEVERPTTLHALASADFGLEREGWVVADDSVRVAAAGAAFDRLYRRDLSPGRYVVRQGYATTALPVFWREGDVKPLP